MASRATTHITNSKLASRVQHVDGRYHWSKFMVKSSLFFTFLTVALVVSVVFRLFFFETMKNIYSGFGRVFNNGYAFLALFVFLAILIVGSTLHRQLSYFKSALAFLLVVCYWYFAGFLMVNASKPDNEWFQTLVLLFAAFTIAGLANLINMCIFSRKRVGSTLTFCLAFVMFGLLTVYLSMLYKNPLAEDLPLYTLNIPRFFVFSVLCGAFAVYLTKAIVFTVDYRSFDLEGSDWLAGTVCMHTDIFYRFWYHLYLAVQGTTEVTEELHIVDEEYVVEEDAPRTRHETTRTAVDL